jgi:DHA1 family tetracycline resistance protein-like MFS transporter
MNRFLVLVALRWLPTGLVVPVSVLLPLERGLTLAQAGAIAAVQGIVVGVLELPTGGLTDSLGRKPVLLAAAVLNLASLCLFAGAASVTAFVTYYLLQGVYRALDSGPLEAWYVDHALAGDPGADIETGLSRSGIVLGAAVAGGALLGGGLVALGPLGPFSALTVPVLTAIVINVIALVCLVVLMSEPDRGFGREVVSAALRGVPRAIGGAVRLARRSRVIVALLGVELLWGFGMVAFEKLLPVRLSEIVGGAAKASTLLGPAGSAAWGASARPSPWAASC